MRIGFEETDANLTQYQYASLLRFLNRQLLPLPVVIDISLVKFIRVFDRPDLLMDNPVTWVQHQCLLPLRYCFLFFADFQQHQTELKACVGFSNLRISDLSEGAGFMD